MLLINYLDTKYHNHSLAQKKKKKFKEIKNMILLFFFINKIKNKSKSYMKNEDDHNYIQRGRVKWNTYKENEAEINK